MQQTDLQLTSAAEPNHIAVDETVIQIDDERNWLYAAVDSNTNEFLHGRLCQACTTERTMLLRREPREKVPVIHATILVDNAHHFHAALARLAP